MTLTSTPRRDAETTHDPHAKQGTHRGHHVQWGVLLGINPVVTLRDK
jgi:hypothetical protein